MSEAVTVSSTLLHATYHQPFGAHLIPLLQAALTNEIGPGSSPPPHLTRQSGFEDASVQSIQLVTWRWW